MNEPPDGEAADFTIGVGEDVELPHLTIPADLGQSPDPDEPASGEPAAAQPEADSPDQAEPEQIGVPDWAVEAATVAVFEYLASKRGEHWKLTDAEAQAIAIPLAAELTELLSSIGMGVSADAIPFLTARRLEIISAIAEAMVPRYMQDREYASLATAVAAPAAEVLDPMDGSPAGGAGAPVNGYDPDAPASMADALAAKQEQNKNGATE